jgi:hypothetical protein
MDTYSFEIILDMNPTDSITLGSIQTSNDQLSKDIDRIKHLMRELTTKNNKTKKKIISKSLETMKKEILSTKMKIREADVNDTFKDDMNQFESLKKKFKEISDDFEELEALNSDKKPFKFNPSITKDDSLEQSLALQSKDNFSLTEEDSAYLDTESKIQYEKMQQMEILEEEMRGLYSAQLDIHGLVREQGESLLASSNQLESATQYTEYGVTEIQAVLFHYLNY